MSISFVTSFDVLNFKSVKKYGVSSVLNRDVKLFGKKCLFDDQEDTCWNSEKGSPQWISLELTEEVAIAALRIRFQGGFAGQNCSVVFTNSSGEKISQPIYPEDNNQLQEFPCEEPVKAKEILIRFEDSTDFFGRIIVYCLQVCVVKTL